MSHRYAGCERRFKGGFHLIEFDVGGEGWSIKIIGLPDDRVEYVDLLILLSHLGLFDLDPHGLGDQLERVSLSTRYNPVGFTLIACHTAVDNSDGFSGLFFPPMDLVRVCPFSLYCPRAVLVLFLLTVDECHKSLKHAPNTLKDDDSLVKDGNFTTLSKSQGLREHGVFRIACHVITKVPLVFLA